MLSGSRVRIEGRWRANRFLDPRSRFVPPERRGIVWADSVVAERPSWAQTPLLYLRGALSERLWRLYPPEDAALALSLVVARRESLDPELYETFIRAGLAHLLAISGLHVGLVALGWLFLLRLFRVRERFLFPTAAGGVLFYVALIGAPPSAVRAAAMVVLYLLTRRLGRPSGLSDVFGVAAVAILVVDPGAFLEPGFQLSFAGAASATYAAGRAKTWTGRAGPSVRALATGVAVSAAAFLGTLPFTLAHFGRAAPVGIVSNLAAVPLLGLLLPALFASLVLSPLPALASVPADAAVALLGLLRTVAVVSAAPAWGSIEVPRIHWAAALGLGLAIAWVAWAARVPGFRARAILAAGVASALALIAPVASPFVGGRPLEIVALDVGQGDAVALRTPAGRWLLVDAGPAGRRWDAGARTVAPYLRRRGVGSLSALVLTHPDADHIGGAPSVIERLEVRRVLDPGYAAGGADYVRALESAAEEGADVLIPRAGGGIDFDGLRIVFLAPSDSAVANAGDANEASTWFLMSYGEFRAAFTGDAPAVVEEAAARAAGPVHLLKVSHHGSATATSAEVLRLLRPRLAIISAGRRNRYRHPHAEVLDRLMSAGVEIRRTDREGTIHVRAWPSGRMRVSSLVDVP